MGEQYQLRDKDRVVLEKVRDGYDDIQKITSQTTLENYHVTYCFHKLEEHGLLHVSRPEGTVERTVNGQKKVFQAPKQAELTDKGKKYLQHSKEDTGRYEDMSHRELVEKIHQLENRMEEMECKLELFRKQVSDKLNSF